MFEGQSKPLHNESSFDFSFTIAFLYDVPLAKTFPLTPGFDLNWRQYHC
jgi:hypothetical protein